MADHQGVDPGRSPARHGAARSMCRWSGTGGRRDLSHEIAGMAETSGQRVAENYWFKCSACDYDWPSLLTPSIIFVSLSFVTDQCPNCGKKHVPAYKVGPGR
jgi:hypothetical protein